MFRAIAFAVICLFAVEVFGQCGVPGAQVGQGNIGLAGCGQGCNVQVRQQAITQSLPPLQLQLAPQELAPVAPMPKGEATVPEAPKPSGASASQTPETLAKRQPSLDTASLLAFSAPRKSSAHRGTIMESTIGSFAPSQVAMTQLFKK